MEDLSAHPQPQPATDSNKSRETTYQAAVADISWFSKYLCPKQAFHTKCKNEHFSPFWTLIFKSKHHNFMQSMQIMVKQIFTLNLNQVPPSCVAEILFHCIIHYTILLARCIKSMRSTDLMPVKCDPSSSISLKHI